MQAVAKKTPRTGGIRRAERSLKIEQQTRKYKHASAKETRSINLSNTNSKAVNSGSARAETEKSKLANRLL